MTTINMRTVLAESILDDDAVLTTEHASCYGIPVLVRGGVALGPAEAPVLEEAEQDAAAMAAWHASMPQRLEQARGDYEAILAARSMPLDTRYTPPTRAILAAARRAGYRMSAGLVAVAALALE